MAPVSDQRAPSTSETGGIAVRGVCKRFGGVQALDGVDLDVAPGQVVALLGPNGAGKTTLLRILSTLVTPDAGEVSVGGFDALAEPGRVRERIGLVLPDDRSWAWRLTGRQNLAFFATLLRIPKRETAARIERCLGLVDLTDAADRRFDGYSAGMRARLSLARALLADPAVLLLDEPARSLDPVAAAAFRRLLRAVVASHRASVLLVTHDLHEAAEVADATVMLHGGRVRGRLAGDVGAAELERAFLAVAGA